MFRLVEKTLIHAQRMTQNRTTCRRLQTRAPARSSFRIGPIGQLASTITVSDGPKAVQH